MKDNNLVKQKTFLEININKYLFIGFIIGIIPFILILSILTINIGKFKAIPLLFRNTIIIAGLITSLCNAWYLKKIIKDKI